MFHFHRGSGFNYYDDNQLRQAHRIGPNLINWIPESKGAMGGPYETDPIRGRYERPHDAGGTAQ